MVSTSNHLLQTPQWGALKSEFGWAAETLPGGLLVLFRRLPLGYSIGYIPKAPPEADWTGLLPDVTARCRARRAVFLKIEPDAWEGDQVFDFTAHGFRPAAGIQPRRTIVIDLRGSEDDLLARMKQKTRYNIRLAEKKGVVVRASNDVSLFATLIDETAARDGFGVHSAAYYRRAYELFHPAGTCELLVAEAEGRPLAALMVFAVGTRSWYLYGASSNELRHLMPTYLLQWAALRWAREKGCESYDLYGVPDVDEARLEAEFSNRSDGLWGVYRFKRGFGGDVLRAAESWDLVYNEALYLLAKALRRAV
ncbi:MAG: peptidoglycan bridge formation glycyltransferase FemA/FemB family protein [Anaerolineae bacterium]|nr:MAG: peptidoglycan bridge formation glycyltransferase FemA/FemB family protein [Anaerolineae bacterium]